MTTDAEVEALRVVAVDALRERLRGGLHYCLADTFVEVCRARNGGEGFLVETNSGGNAEAIRHGVERQGYVVQSVRNVGGLYFPMSLHVTKDPTPICPNCGLPRWDDPHICPGRPAWGDREWHEVADAINGGSAPNPADATRSNAKKPYLCACPPTDPRPCAIHGGGAS